MASVDSSADGSGVRIGSATAAGHEAVRLTAARKAGLLGGAVPGGGEENWTSSAELPHDDARCGVGTAGLFLGPQPGGEKGTSRAAPLIDERDTGVALRRILRAGLLARETPGVRPDEGGCRLVGLKATTSPGDGGSGMGLDGSRLRRGFLPLKSLSSVPSIPGLSH